MLEDLTTALATTHSSLDTGIALVMAAEDGGDWKPVIDWLATNPGRATGLADFLATQRGFKAAFSPPMTGRSLGGLEIGQEIGRGAMGIVYLAHDPMLKRDVAVKMISALGEADRVRFRFEGEVAAELNHPHVVPVLYCGEADGVPYLVMPHLAGGSLAQWLRNKGPDRLLSPEQAARLLRGIALGIHHAHQHGLIHRDLKPGNILLDEEQQPRIADFGLARRVDMSISCAAGTPAYMAPEQARGDKQLTVSVDIYALGVILFEFLTGQPPFIGEGFATVLRRIEEEPAPSLHSFRTGVPADLESICRRCLEKRPEDRYPSAQAVADDLTRFLAGDAIAGSTRGMVTDVSRALQRLVPTRGIGSWPMLFFGAANSTLSLAAVQVAVLLDAPIWVTWVALASYFGGWLAILWIIILRYRFALTSVERGSLTIQLGMKFAALSLLPAQAWLHNGAVAPLFAPFFVVIGLGIFIGGGTFWGRLYFVGMLEFLVATLLPLVPVIWWPGLYCLTQLAIQVWLGWQIWRIHHRGLMTA